MPSLPICRPHQARRSAGHRVGRFDLAPALMVKRFLGGQLYPLRNRRELSQDSDAGSQKYRNQSRRSTRTAVMIARIPGGEYAVPH